MGPGGSFIRLVKQAGTTGVSTRRPDRFKQLRDLRKKMRGEVGNNKLASWDMPTPDFSFSP